MDLSRPLGGVCKALSLLIQHHEPTTTTFQLIRSRFQLYCEMVKTRSNAEMEIVQTGSSYDDLHMCRNVSANEKNIIFYPTTDFDFMMVYTKFTVKDFTGEIKDEMDCDEKNKKTEAEKLQSEHAFIMVPSNHLGYVKLMVTDKGRKMLTEKKSKLLNHIDQDGFLSNDAFKKGLVMDESTEIIYSRIPEAKYIASGPAISSYENEERGFTYDFVHAFPCDAWPEVAHRWNKRPRDANWPSEELRIEIIKSGCAVVPVGFYTSEEQDKEWRLSFNNSERKLSLHLNENQKICYCIVKLLIKVSLPQHAVLTSYMVKNMMFWFCEQQYGYSDWTDGQLGDRVLQLISYICTALEHGNIPHYFLPFNNMIRHKSKENITATLREMQKLKEFPYKALADVCMKMHLFTALKDKAGLFSTGGELQIMLTLFTSSVQLLLDLGLLNYDAPKFALQCFSSVVELNTSVKPFIRHCSNLFASTSIPQLLKPIAMQYMQNGQIERSLAFFQMMFEADRALVIEKYPDTMSNIACLIAASIDSEVNKTKKEVLSKKADENFQQALRYISDSSTLHFAYGNFLKDQKISLIRAVDEFEKAISIKKKRDDDDALVQITLPGQHNDSTNLSYIPGKAVAFYNLTDSLVDLDDMHKARKTAKEFEQYALTLDIKHRKTALQLCSFLYRKIGLHVKATLLTRDAMKYAVLEQLYCI